MRHLLFVILIANCGGTLAAAASPAEGTRTCRILFLSPPENAPKTVSLSDGASVRQVALPNMNLSESYSLATGDITLRMFSEKPAEGQPIPEQAPKVDVAEAVKDLFLLVYSDPTNAVAPLRMQVIDANPDDFRPGRMLCFNLSPFAVSGQAGTIALNMKPESRLVAEPPAAGYEDFPVSLSYVPVEGQPAEPFCSTTWRHDPTVRSVVFIFMPPRGRAPQVLGFVDSRAKPKAK
jgi:hypothetical protein